MRQCVTVCLKRAEGVRRMCMLLCGVSSFPSDWVGNSTVGRTGPSHSKHSHCGERERERE